MACLVLTAAGASLGALSLAPQSPVLVLNLTASVPAGLYHVSRTQARKGDILALAPAGVARDMLDAFGALPAGKLLLKRLVAVNGDTVCRSGTSITVNDAEAATARSTSTDGRVLPTWSGCRVLRASEIFVLAPHPDSFDGRYFGPIGVSQIIGVAGPLLTLPQTDAS